MNNFQKALDLYDYFGQYIHIYIYIFYKYTITQKFYKDIYLLIET